MHGQHNEGGVVLVLFLLILALARWRFSLPGWTALLDQLGCLVATAFWPCAPFGLAIPLFESMLKGQPWYGAPGIIWVLGFSPLTLPLILATSQACFTGCAIRGWVKGIGLYQREADQQRRAAYELEQLKGELLESQVHTARLAELTERNRIAQELHDDVGHELTGAVLALQAFTQLWSEDDPAAKEMLSQAMQRLNNCAQQLRETVHNVKPLEAVGVHRLEEICQRFTACPIIFNSYGDVTTVPTYLWTILEPCLKEALTNVIRHAQATQVNVTLDIGLYIVRLYVENDGGSQDVSAYGIGLRNLRQRARSVGGSVSTDNSDGFRLVCVLPLEEDQP